MVKSNVAFILIALLDLEIYMCITTNEIGIIRIYYGRSTGRSSELAKQNVLLLSLQDDNSINGYVDSI